MRKSAVVFLFSLLFVAFSGKAEEKAAKKPAEALKEAPKSEKKPEPAKKPAEVTQTAPKSEEKTAPAEKHPCRPNLDITEAADIIYADRIFNVRARAWLEPVNPKDNIEEALPVTVEAKVIPADSRTKEYGMSFDKKLLAGTDRARSVNLPLNIAGLGGRALVRFKLNCGKNKATVPLELSPADEPGENLTAKGFHLYRKDGARVSLVLTRRGESHYRRWAVPRTLQRWYATPDDAGVLALTCDREDKDWLGNIAGILSKNNRNLTILRPGRGEDGSAAPILGLLCKFAAYEPKNERTVVINPGIADIYYGTPPSLWGRSLRAILDRIEAIYPRGHINVIVATPALPEALQHLGKPYQKELLAISRERLLGVFDTQKILDQNADWGQNGELLYPNGKAQQKVAQKMAVLCDNRRKRIAAHILAWGAEGLLVAFVVVQFFTRRRLKKLVAITTAD